ncbi:tRNA preQ1(34) S-adenosylmethionine ribosyltransferase-isomerase QueA [Aureimonas phyllosphaerae]|uniref:S-adenosylmethionine:tRNA ribosyltransferase-isomerase n=1 Tax=Aureimonas phyllosphaerae TaxID=1166078 RepID=A0A7W6BNX7_9HYPH|nr:tRNA preQ1(34) S-adenosylmethionine ribosyltransferase-isomerase QueA [Aureimonas phyllosphaerae]MBB3935408.1 S-adenosylmethionine:tRNA ribosyltransferase-isomerase [Aureimonas phyllosphaerae]MBB3959416.1 S-adenosylmethionine:tRNA ribosyltransferase-isomerase [Aureimonas phyllosphaerae]SFF03281.1 S-adenosylmethionine:tRNA ribosyltransferase-isomerase [Aureimonas phyllosphaerae]
MQVDLFDFELPEERIALRPALPRESARLLYVPASGPFADCRVGDLPDFLREGDVLVFNDTKVIPAQLTGERIRAGSDGSSRVAVDATLHMRIALDRWKAFMRPGKRIKVGDLVVFSSGTATDPGLEAVVLEKGEGGEVNLRFTLAGPELDAAISVVGHLPLPPYIASKRAVDDDDLRDYQTVFAREEGAVAAPTAGLHFTPELLAELEYRGVMQEFVTLHVGAGTFLPVKADDTTEHRMHSEIGVVTKDVAERLQTARDDGRRIVAVGTTSLRLLESAARATGRIEPFSDATDIFITPGFQFRAVDALMTNFHLPRSTLFMLVSAFSGLDRMRAAYDHAIAGGYRFYSYGDACLLERSA